MTLTTEWAQLLLDEVAKNDGIVRIEPNSIDPTTERGDQHILIPARRLAELFDMKSGIQASQIVKELGGTIIGKGELGNKERCVQGFNAHGIRIDLDAVHYAAGIRKFPQRKL